MYCEFVSIQLPFSLPAESVRIAFSLEIVKSRSWMQELGNATFRFFYVHDLDHQKKQNFAFNFIAVTITTIKKSKCVRDVLVNDATLCLAHSFVRNEMHIFSRNKAIPRNIAQNKKLYSLERWITKWNAIRIFVFFVVFQAVCERESKREMQRKRMQTKRDATHTANTHNFRCLSNNNGRKRMKMDWNKITNERKIYVQSKHNNNKEKPRIKTEKKRTNFCFFCCNSSSASKECCTACTFRHYFVFYRE